VSRAIGIGLALLAAVSAGAVARETGRRKAGDAARGGKMEDARSTAIETVRLRDDEYFALDDAGVKRLQDALVARLTGGPLPPPDEPEIEPEPVLALGAPASVAVDRHDDLPVLMAKQATGLREWQVHPAQNELIVAVDLRSGTLRTSRLHVSHKREAARPPSGSGPRPDDLNAEALLIGVNRYAGVGRALGLPWRPGRFALTVLEHDRASNTVTVELSGPTSAPEPPLGFRVPSPFLAPEKANGAGGPEEASLTVPAHVKLQGPIPVAGTLRVPRATAVLAPALRHDPGAPEDPRDVKLGDPHLVIASLLLVALDAEAPIAVDLAVPAHDVRGPGGEALVEARFAFDARAATGGHVLGGLYQVYLVTGDRVVGPRRLVVGL
jgi:hypothetical protein